MAAFETKIRRIIEKHLREGVADLETLPDGTVCGHIVSPEFARDATYEDRRRRLRRILESNLSNDQLAKVSTLLTYTPEEWTVKLP